MTAEEETGACTTKPEYDGSTPLTKPRWETFAQLFSAGLAQGKAYIAAGFNPKDAASADAGAYKLASKPDVITRLEYLKPKADETLQTWLAQNLTSDIIDRGERIRGYAVRRQSLLRVMAERSVDTRHQGIPGIRSGALVVTERFNAKGKLIYRETKTDTGLFRALLDIEKQAAIELRQWVEQHRDLPFDPTSLSDEDLNKLLDNFAKSQPATYEQARKALGLSEGELLECGPVACTSSPSQPASRSAPPDSVGGIGKSVHGIAAKPRLVDPFD